MYESQQLQLLPVEMESSVVVALLIASFTVCGVSGQLLPTQSVVFMERAGRTACAGSFVNKEWLITAASCIDIPLEDIKLHVGTEDAGIIISAERKVVHPFYTGQKFSAFNVGLLKIEKLSQEEEDVITQIDMSSSELTKSGRGIVLGWNFKTNNHARMLSMFRETFTILNDHACFVGDELENISETSFCAGDSNKHIELCPESIGSPFTTNSVVLGILTATDCNEQFASVFEDVSIHNDWIKAHTGEANE